MKAGEGVKHDFIVNIKGLKEINRLSPHFVTLNCAQSVFRSLTPFVGLFTSSLIIDELLGGMDIKRLTVYVLASISAALAIGVTERFMGKKINEKRNLWQWNKGKSFGEKTLTMDYDLLEDPKTHLLRQKIKEAENTNGSGLWTVVNSLSGLLRGFFSVVFSLAVVTALLLSNGNDNASGIYAFIGSPLMSVLLLLLIFSAAVLSAYTNGKAAKRMFTDMDGFTQANRKYSYYLENYLQNYQTGKDIRIYNLKPLISDEMAEMNRMAAEKMKRMSSVLGRYECVNSAFSALTGGLAYAFVALRALVGLVTIGSILRYTGAATQMVTGLTNMFSGVSQLRANTKFLELYFDYMALEGERYHGTLPVEKRNDNNYIVEFKNVSFKYPGTDAYVLEDISFTFRVGERLAVVGMNGSGKTTMIKLLVRLYDPTEGEITLNGIEIKKYAFDEYASLFSVVFQDFKLFSFPLAQNVAASAVYDADDINAALEKTGILERVDAMPDGIETPLYKDFDENGVEVSGGEAQKIALSRALYKDAPFIVLDEPTAALDPISESEVYASFDRMVSGKTVIYISHRLSSCRFCDNIIVFHEGVIVQTGSHEALLSNGDGKYAGLWNAQAQYYENEAIFTNDTA